jgi:fructuronate reductase
VSGRLCDGALSQLPAGVERPRYDRGALATGIVHLGLGAFHRAHQAVYTDSVLADDPRWGIAGVSLRSADTRDALAPQDGLYSVASVDGAGARHRVIGALTTLIVAPENPAALIALMAAPATRIVSLTITEKGYCHDPATGALRESDPDVAHDLSNLSAPRTALGFIVAAARARRDAGVGPLTILSCDNLPNNGATVRKLALAFASRVDPALAGWMAEAFAFPSTMVDRIVPATTPEDRARAAAALGVEDAWPIVTEPFTQWVIEDRFAAGRPAWEKAGAQFVDEIAPYELTKLRLLNGSHSTLAYLGYLMGHETVAAAMGEPGLARLVEGLMREEAVLTLPALAGFDHGAYQRQLLERFRNPALKHRTWQIAMDGSQKLPQRLLGTARDLIAMGRPFGRVAFGIAAWMRYVTGIDEKGAPIDVRDPLAGTLRKIADEAGPDAARLAPALLSVEAVFGRDLAADPRFAGPVTAALDQLFRVGAKAAALNAAQGAL